MSDKQNFVFTLKGIDDTEPAFQSLLERAKAAGAKISQNMNGGGGKPEWMEGLKQQFGRESAFGGLGEMLKGGGALIGITAAAEAIHSIADGVDKFQHDSEDADKNWADLSMDALQSVPVFGSIAEAGEAISESLTHAEEHLRMAKEEAAGLDKELEVHKKLIAEGLAYYKDIEATIERIKTKTAEIGLAPFDKEQIETQGTNSAANTAATDKFTETKKNLTDTASPMLHDLDKQIMAEQAELAEIQSRGGTMHTIGAFLKGDAPPDVKDSAEAAASQGRLTDLMNQHAAMVRNRDDQISKAKSVSDALVAANDEQAKKQLAQQQKEHDRQMQDDARQSAIEHTASIAEQGAAEMQLRGQFLNANVAQIHASAEKEIAELRLGADKKEEDLKKGSKEWLAIEADVAQKSSDIRQQASDKEAEARRKDQEYEREQIQHHAQEIADIQAETRDKALRAVGKTFEADREQLQRQHNDRIAKIKADAQAEIDAHGEHKDEIQKRAQESINAENQSYAVGSLAQKIEAMKSMGPVDMTASSDGGVGLDSSSLTGLAAPTYMKEAAAAEYGKKVKGLQDQMGAIAPTNASGTPATKSNDSGIVGAIEKVLVKLSEPRNIRISFV